MVLLFLSRDEDLTPEVRVSKVHVSLNESSERAGFFLGLIITGSPDAPQIRAV